MAANANCGSSSPLPRTPAQKSRTYTHVHTHGVLKSVAKSNTLNRAGQPINLHPRHTRHKCPLWKKWCRILMHLFRPWGSLSRSKRKKLSSFSPARFIISLLRIILIATSCSSCTWSCVGYRTTKHSNMCAHKCSRSCERTSLSHALTTVLKTPRPMLPVTLYL